MLHTNPKYNAIQDPTGLIPDDEPVFLLRGSDPCTPTAIQAWLSEATRAGVPLTRRNDVADHLNRIVRYQLEHKDLVHVPGTART